MLKKTKPAPTIPKEQATGAAGFEGFAPEDFEVFEYPEFALRMPLLKERITPKLKLLAAALNNRMGEALEETVYPHVALHLRRTVNPPQETWAAFARNARAYKPYVHIRVGISAEKVRVVAFVEDYADEKQTFAENLARNAELIAAWLAHHPTIHAYDIEDADGAPTYGSRIDAAALRAFAERMLRVKGQHARFGIPFARTHPVIASGPQLMEAALNAARDLRPIYDCGKPGFVYTYST